MAPELGTVAKHDFRRAGKARLRDRDAAYRGVSLDYPLFGPPRYSAGTFKRGTLRIVSPIAMRIFSTRSVQTYLMPF